MSVGTGVHASNFLSYRLARSKRTQARSTLALRVAAQTHRRQSQM